MIAFPRTCISDTWYELHVRVVHRWLDSVSELVPPPPPFHAGIMSACSASNGSDRFQSIGLWAASVLGM